MNGADLFPYQIKNPNASRAEEQVAEQLADSQTPADELRMLRPPIDVMLFPDRFGYPPKQDREPTVLEVLRGPRETMRDGLGALPEDTYSGADRNYMNVQNPLG